MNEFLREVSNEVERSKIESLFTNNDDNSLIMEKLNQSIIPFFKNRYGTPPYIVEKWCEFSIKESSEGSADPARLNYIFQCACDVLEELESEHIDQNEFYSRDIIMIFRYPLSLLKLALKQENVSNKYGVVIVGRNDKNGVFIEDYTGLDHLAQDLQDIGYGVVLKEIEHRYSLVKLVIECEKQYQNHTPGLVYILAHSDSISLEFDKGLQGELTSNDIKSLQSSRIIDFYTNACFVIPTCEIGDNEGLASAISKKFDVEVLATKGVVEKTDVQVLAGSDGLDVELYLERGDSNACVVKYLSGHRIA